MLTGYLDRFEEQYAVIVLDGEPPFQFDLPRQLLPEGLAPGDRLTLRIDPDPEGARKTLENIERLQRELTEEDNPDQIHFQL
ncbi:MAG: DUF3006 domain-containing protein [Blastocatellia bacterium]|jgi:hypothetical protein|nr:DUF3006 domain-containing protein [Blastocatellia bacterium]